MNVKADTPAPLEATLDLLGLPAAELAKSQPQLMQHLGEQCRACPQGQQCADDLAHDRVDQTLEPFCPNRDTLHTLAQLR